MKGNERKNWVTQKLKLGEDTSASDISVWSKVSMAEKMVQTWNLSKLHWEIHKKGSFEQGLPRRIARVIRS